MISRNEMIKELKSFCNDRECCCDYDSESICPLIPHEWNCQFHTLSDSELTKEYHYVFGKKVTIPVGATNGDVIKAMFPYVNVKNECAEYYSVNIENLQEDIACNTVGFSKDWWNAPYKVESEE